LANESRIKSPKAESGKRSLVLPAFAADMLNDHRKTSHVAPGVPRLGDGSLKGDGQTYNTPKKDKATAATITSNGMIRLAQMDLGPPKSDCTFF
jgi:hypothetical protein